jgi:hypothetical protein
MKDKKTLGSALAKKPAKGRSPLEPFYKDRFSFSREARK